MPNGDDFDPGGHVVNTSRIWEELRSLRDLVIEMKSKLDQVPDHELRLRQLEARRFPMPIIVMWIAVINVIATVATFLFIHK